MSSSNVAVLEKRESFFIIILALFIYLFASLVDSLVIISCLLTLLGLYFNLHCMPLKRTKTENCLLTKT